jgi:hypothetical protein
MTKSNAKNQVDDGLSVAAKSLVALFGGLCVLIIVVGLSLVFIWF